MGSVLSAGLAGLAGAAFGSMLGRRFAPQEAEPLVARDAVAVVTVEVPQPRFDPLVTDVMFGRGALAVHLADERRVHE